MRLELDDNGLDAASMEALGKWAGKGNLLRLSLAGNGIRNLLEPEGPWAPVSMDSDGFHVRTPFQRTAEGIV